MFSIRFNLECLVNTTYIWLYALNTYPFPNFLKNTSSTFLYVSLHVFDYMLHKLKLQKPTKNMNVSKNIIQMKINLSLKEGKPNPKIEKLYKIES